MQTLTGLRKFVCPEIMTGAGAIDMTGQFVRNFEVRRAMIVTDPGVMKAGWSAVVEASLAAANVPFVVFSSVTPNPRAEEVKAGAEYFTWSGCDALVAV